MMREKSRNHFNGPEWNIKLLNDVLSRFVRLLSICLVPLIQQKERANQRETEREKNIYICLTSKLWSVVVKWVYEKFSARKLISYEQNVYHILNEELKKTGLNASLRAKHKSDQLKMSKQEKANIILVSPSRPFACRCRALTLLLRVHNSSFFSALALSLICYLLVARPPVAAAAAMCVDGVSKGKNR